MNFHLSGLFQNQNTTDQVYNTSDSKEALTASANRQVALASLQPGSSITGTVVSTEDGTITIKLADESVLMASLKQDVSLNPGAVVSFLVQSNHNNQITLNPLFTNVMGASKNIENALQAASLPINETTTAMVGQMMKQGMSIDKGSLMNMYREIMANPDIDAGTAVRLSNMNLAINELNAENLKMYDSMNHQLMEGIGDITDELQNVMSGLSIKSPDQAATLFRQVVDLFLPGTAAHGGLLAGNIRLGQHDRRLLRLIHPAGGGSRGHTDVPLRRGEQHAIRRGRQRHIQLGGGGSAEEQLRIPSLGALCGAFAI